MKFLAIAFIAFIANTNAGPVNIRLNQQCSRACKESNKFSYETGKTYVYSYEADTKTKLQGTTEESSNINFKATALIEIVSKCELVLRVEDVRLYESDSRRQSSGSEIFRRELERHPLAFSFQDGIIDAICPSAEENTRILNIKRGILSALQNSMENFRENMRVQEGDITGNCLTDYVVSSNAWGTTTIEKTKDLTGCTERYGNESSLQATSYQHNSEVKSLPLLKSTSVCTQQINYNRLQKTACTETQVFRPFSKHNNGAVTTTTQVLQYSTTKNENKGIYYPILDRSNLLFEHKFTGPKDADNAQASHVALRDLCLAGHQDITPEVPRLFARFVSKLRELNYDKLYTLYSEIDQVCNERVKAEKFFYDAVPMVGTAASIRLIRELVSSNKVSTTDANFWLLSVAFVPNPAKEMIDEISPLMDHAKLKRNAMLTAATLVHSYCKTNMECKAEREVRAVIETLTQNLGSRCRESDNEKVMISLRALGTAGCAVDSVSTLIQCLSDKENQVEIRLAAIEAFERVPCSISRDTILSQFMDVSEDVEVRIASYLSVMKCPSHDVLRKVKESLEREEVNQVGSFVWTHLENLRESSDPNKREIQTILDNYKLQRQFNKDARKFSRAFEKSMFFESINTGAHVDGHVIMSPKSYIPRSFMLNASVDLFGNTVNLLEIGGRSEGLESIVESLFKSNAFFNKPSNNINENSQPRREINNKNKIDDLHKRFNAKSGSDPQGSLYFKVFGNMLRYYNFEDMAAVSELKDSLNILELLIKLSKEQDFDYSKNVIFMESSLIVPTICGLPLRLSVNGTASINLKVSGKLDIRKMIAFPRSCDIKGHIKPSAAIEISSMMGVDAFVTNAGLKMVSTLHTSTALDGELEIKDSRLVNIQLNMPQEKMEILNVQTQFFLVTQGEELAQKGITVDRFQKFGCSGEYTNKALGIEFCSEIQFPNASLVKEAPYFPFTGPASAKFYITKTDPTLTNYKFEAILKSDKIRVGNEMITSTAARMSFNTPGSSIDRELTFDFKLNRADKIISLELKSPWKKLGLEGKYSNDEDLKRVKVEVKSEERTVYSALAELRIDSTNSQIQYNPKVEIQIPGQESLTFTGSINYLKNFQNRKLNLDLSLKNLVKYPVTLKGDFQQYVKGGIERYSTDLVFSSHYLNSKIDGYINKNNGIITSKGDLIYDSFYYGIPTQTLSTTTKIRNSSSSQLLKYTSVFDIHFSRNPSWNTLINWEIQKTNQHLENKLEITRGQNVRINKLKIEQILTYDITSLSKVFLSSTIRANYPPKNIDFQMVIKHSHTDRSLSNEFNMRINPQKTISSSINLLDETQNYLRKMNGEIKVHYPGREFVIIQTLEETVPREYRLETTIQWQRGEKLEAVTIYKNQSGRDKFIHDFSSEVRRPRAQPITVKANVKAADGIYSLSANSDYEGQSYSFISEMNNQNSYKRQAKLILNHPNYQYSGLATHEQRNNDNKVTVDIKLDNYRHITGEASLTTLENQKEARLDFKWDADRDNNQAIITEASYKRSGNNQIYQGSVNFRSPWKNIKSTFNTRNQGQLKSGTHKTYFDFEWNPRQKISVTIDGNTNFNPNLRQMSSALSIYTPFNGFRSIVMKFNHSDLQNEFNCALEGKLDYNQMKLELTGKNEKSWNIHSTAGKISFASSFKEFEQLSASFRSDLKDDQLNSQAILQWARNQQISIKFDGSQSFNRRIGRELDGTLSFSSPFSGFEIASLILKHRNTNDNLYTDVQSSWGPNNKMGLVINGKLNTNYNVNLEGSVRFTSSFKNFEDLSILLTHNHGNLKYKCHLEAGWSSYDKIIFDSQGQFIESSYSKDMETSMSISTPFKLLRSLATKYTHKNNDRQTNCYWEASWNNNQKITLRVSGRHEKSYSNREIEGKIQFTSTFKSFENIVFIANHKNKNNEYNSNLELQYGIGQVISLSNDLKVDINSEIHKIEQLVQFRSPFRNFESHSLNFNYDSTYNNYKSFVSYSWGVSKTFEVKTEWKDNSVNSQTKLYGSLKYSYQNKLNSDNRLVEFIHSYDGTRLNSKISLDWTRDQKYVIEAEMTNDFPRKFDSKISLISRPLSLYNDIILTSSFENRNNKYTAEGSFQWNKLKKISLNGNLETDGLHRINGNLNFKSPFQNFEAMSMKLDLDAASTKSLDFSVQLFGKTIQLLANLQYDSVSHQESTITLRTPFNGYEELICMFKVTNIADEYQTTVSIQWAPRKKVELNGSLKLQDNYELSADLITPFQGYESLKISSNLFLKNNQYISNVVYQWSSWEKIELNSRIKMDPFSFLDGTITFKSPFSGFETLSLMARYTYLDGRLNGQSSFQWSPNKKITISCDAAKNYNNWEGKLIFTSPFYKYESLTFNGNHLNSRGRYISNIEFQWYDNKKISFESNIAASSYGFPNFEGIYNLKTPFHGFESWTLNMKQTYSRQKYTSSLEFEWNTYKKVSLSIDHSKTYGGYECKFVISTPFEVAKSAVLTYSHNVNNNDIIANLQFERNRQKNFQFGCEIRGHYEKKFNLDWNIYKRLLINVEHNGHRNNFNGKTQIQTPLAFMENFLVSYSHESKETTSSHIFLQNNEQKLLRLKYNNLGSKVGLEIQTPWRDVSGNYFWEKASNDFTLTSELCWDLLHRDSSTIKGEIKYNDRSHVGRKHCVLNIKFTHPSRAINVYFTLQKSSTNFEQGIDFSWNSEGSKVSYVINANDMSTSWQKKYDTTVKVNYPFRALELGMKHESSSKAFISQALFKWDADRDPTRQVSAKVDYQNRGRSEMKSHRMELTLQHPKLKKNIVAKMEMALNNGRELFSGKTEVDYSLNPLKKMQLSARVLDVSSWGKTNYSLTSSLTYPEALLNVNLLGSMSQSNDQLSGNMMLSYQNRYRQTKNMAIRAMIDKIQKKIELEMNTANQYLLMNGRYEERFNGQKSIYTIAGEGKINNERAVYSEMEFVPEDRSYKMSLEYNPEKRNAFYLSANFPNSSSVMLDAYRLHDGRRITEGQFALRLNNSHLLHSRLYWRPSVYGDLTSKTETEYNVISDKMNNLLREFSDEVYYEASAKTSFLSNSLNNEFRSLSDDTSTDLKWMHNEVVSYYDDLSNIYNRNEFYLRDIGETFKETNDAVISYLSSFYNDISQKFLNKWNNLLESADVFYYNLHRNLNFGMTQLWHKTITYWSTMNEAVANNIGTYRLQLANWFEDKLEEMLEYYTPKLEKYAIVFHSILNYVEKQIENLFECIWLKVDKLCEHHIVQRIVLFLDELDHYFQTIDYTTALKNHYKTVGNSLSDGYAILNENYNNQVDLLTHNVKKQYRSIMALEEVQLLADYCNIAYQQLLWLHNYLDLENTIRNLAYDSLLASKSMIRHSVENYFNHIYGGNISRVIVFDPARGHIQYEQYLPFEWKSFTQLPDFSSMKEYIRLKDMYNDYYPSDDFSLWDYYYMYAPSCDFSNWIPPFKATGMLIGAQQFMTFDGRFYNFLGECSYLMARDFIDGNFSIIVKYQRGKRSVLFLFDDNTLEIADKKVMLDGQNAELPLEFGQTLVQRQGSRIIIHNKRGVYASYNIDYNFYTFTITGWYYGKTAGLLGTFDNEPNTDFMTPDRTIARDVASFAKSWAVDRYCSFSSNAAREQSYGSVVCDELFLNKESHFRPCYKMVDHKEFHKMCINDESKMCSIASSYKQECHRQGVLLHMPKKCVQCDTYNGKSISRGETAGYKNDQVPRSADTIFVVENKQCNKETVKKADQLLKEIETYLRENYHKNNRYGLVVYGEKTMNGHPQVRTINGEHFGNYQNVNDALNSLAFDDEGYGDHFSAVKFASEYLFRAGVSKNIILMTCSKCEEEKMGLAYGELHRLLLERDITLHLLAEHDFVLKGINNLKKFSKNYIFGIDKKFAYTSKDVRVKTLTGDQDLHHQIEIPKDICVPLALESNGTFFNVYKINDGSKNMKGFTEVFGRQFAKTAEPSNCQLCDCIGNQDGIGKMECRRCVLPVVVEEVENSQVEIVPSLSYDIEGQDKTDYKWQTDFKEYINTPTKKGKSKKSTRN